MIGVFRAGLAEEGDDEGACHVEGGEEGDEEGDGEEVFISAVGGGEDFFFRPEAGGDVGDGDEGGGADGEGDGGDGHFPEEAAHFPDVLLVVAGVDDGPGAEEEEGFEPCVGEEVEHACLADEEADCHDHVAELGEGGVGEDFFNVVLLGGHEGGGEGGDAADPCDGGAGEAFKGAGWEGELDAEEHVDAGGDHGGGVDEGGDGGGAFHGVWEPDVEGELGGLSDCSAEDAEEGGSEDAGGGGDGAAHFREGECAGDAPEDEDADHEAKVSDAVGKEGFFGGVCGGVFLVPMADEEVGAEADELPEDEGHDEVRGEDDACHGEHEEGEAGEVAGLRGIVFHVGEGEDVDE